MAVANSAAAAAAVPTDDDDGGDGHVSDNEGRGGGGREISVECLLWPSAGYTFYTDFLISAFSGI